MGAAQEATRPPVAQKVSTSGCGNTRKRSSRNASTTSIQVMTLAQVVQAGFCGAHAAVDHEQASTVSTAQRTGDRSEALDVPSPRTGDGPQDSVTHPPCLRAWALACLRVSNRCLDQGQATPNGVGRLAELM